jgi:hypothetical protein
MCDPEEEDVIFIKVQDKTTEKNYFWKMYKVNEKIYKVNLEDDFEIVKFGTTETSKIQ